MVAMRYQLLLGLLICHSNEGLCTESGLMLEKFLVEASS
jgi:hypothetical protein